MIKFFRHIRQQLLTENRISKYMLYAIGEIALVVIGILIALQINDWNDQRLLLKKEIETLRAFDFQFKNDIAQFDECLAFHKVSERSMDLILYQLQNDVAYHDSLSTHFFQSTRIYIDADMANHVYETLQSDGVGLISNEELRNKIVLLYEDEDKWIKNFETMYINFVIRASEELFPSRFEDFWHGDYNDPNYSDGKMVPLDFDRLKTDQEYLYFLKTQKNQLGWMIKRPIEETRTKMLVMRSDIQREIDRLEN